MTAAQSLILISLGPLFAAMLVFHGMTKSSGEPVSTPATTSAPQPLFIYPTTPRIDLTQCRRQAAFSITRLLPRLLLKGRIVES